IVLFTLSRYVGRFSMRVGPRLFMGAGPLVCAAGLAGMLRLGRHLTYTTELPPPVLVFALGLALIVAPVASAALADASAGAVAAAGEELDLGAPRQQAVLGVLLLRPGRLVPASTIVTDLWGDAPPGRAENSLQVHVSRLRRALPSELLVTRAPGYLIDVEPGQVAAVRFA